MSQKYDKSKIIILKITLKMSQLKVRDEIRETVKERILIISNIIIDCLFIFIWAVTAWLIKKYAIPFLDAKDFDKTLLDIFQWVSGITTLGILIIYALRDFAIIYLRVINKIKEEQKKHVKKSP